jgi:hypothetical protein
MQIIRMFLKKISNMGVGNFYILGIVPTLLERKRVSIALFKPFRTKKI